MMAAAASMQAMETETVGAELVILESLLCILREKNVLTRADIELLCEHVTRRAEGISPDPLSTCPSSKTRARDTMMRVGAFIGRQYGGKHLRR